MTVTGSLTQSRFAGLRLWAGDDGKAQLPVPIWVSCHDEAELLRLPPGESVLGVDLAECQYLLRSRYPLPPQYRGVPGLSPLTPIYNDTEILDGASYERGWAAPLEYPYLADDVDFNCTDSQYKQELQDLGLQLVQAGPVLTTWAYSQHDVRNHPGFVLTRYNLNDQFLSRMPQIAPFWGWYNWSHSFRRSIQNLYVLTYSIKAAQRRLAPPKDPALKRPSRPRSPAVLAREFNNAASAISEMLRWQYPIPNWYATYADLYWVSCRFFEMLPAFESRFGLWSYRGVEGYAKFLALVAANRIGTLRKYHMLAPKLAAWLDRELRSPLGRLVAKLAKCKTEEDTSELWRKIRAWQLRYSFTTRSSLVGFSEEGWKPPELPPVPRKTGSKSGRKKGGVRVRSAVTPRPLPSSSS